MKPEELLDQSESALLGKGIDNARQESRWILEHILQKNISVPSTINLSKKQTLEFRQLLQRRLNGEPLQYVLGDTEFYNITLEVGPGVLIPRPETESLVECALQICRREKIRSICDLCTGSGAVALALAAELPESTEIIAADISEKALSFTRRNRRRLHFPNVTLLHSDLFEAIPKEIQFDMITANPPYVSRKLYSSLPQNVKNYEPRQALLAADQGMKLIRKIAARAADYLRPSGWVLCEISSEQAGQAADAFSSSSLCNVEIIKDMCRKDRIVRAQKRDRQPHEADPGTRNA